MICEPNFLEISDLIISSDEATRRDYSHGDKGTCTIGANLQKNRLVGANLQKNV